MIICNYKLDTYADYLHQLAALFNTTVHNNQIQLSEPIGSGFFRVITSANGPEAILYDFTLNDTFILNRERDSHEHYTLALDVLERESGFQIKIDTDEATEAVDRTTAFYLTSFLYDVQTVLDKNVNAKGVRLMLTPDWMQHYLQLSQNEAVLEKYLALKTAGVWYKPVTDEMTTLLRDLVSESDKPLLFYQSKIFRIIEHFFEWLYNEMQLLAGKSGINRHDVEAAQKIEAKLTADVTILPPTLKELARESAMSESKLKKIFKAVYGYPPYEYYQRQRMQKARLMLLSGDYSVKDVGYTLGYANLSNFTLAFKKVFDKLPSQLLSK